MAAEKSRAMLAASGRFKKPIITKVTSFERFYVADPARTRTTGAGLGLSIAAAVAGTHNGSVTAEPGSTGGLRVTLQFPIG